MVHYNQVVQHYYFSKINFAMTKSYLKEIISKTLMFLEIMRFLQTDHHVPILYDAF